MVIWTARARADLKAIHDYIAKELKGVQARATEAGSPGRYRPEKMLRNHGSRTRA